MFLEKYAKLKSEVVGSPEMFSIQVYDDENGSKKPVMWLNGEQREQDDVDIIYVNIVDYDNELYYAMSQLRQTNCATVLFKNFLKYYNQNFKGFPVGTHFANYDLQEKFKQAVEKGLFPKESLDYIEEAFEDDYQYDSRFNKSNRDSLQNIKQNPQNYLGANFELSSNTLVKNPSLTQLHSKLEEMIEEYPFLIDLEAVTNFELDQNLDGYVDNNGDVCVYLPFSDYFSEATPNNVHQFYLYSNVIEFFEKGSIIGEIFKTNASKMQSIFDLSNMTIMYIDDAANKSVSEPISDFLSNI